MPARNYYEILQIEPTATDEEIKAAYRRLAWNPTVTGDQAELKLVNDAYATLSSPGRRAAYDAALASGTPAPVTGATQPAALPEPEAEPQPERMPKSPLHFRIWGMITELSLNISRVKYAIIPFTWIIAGMLVGFGFYLMDGYNQIVNEPLPTKATMHSLMGDMPSKKYVAVTAQADYENGYTSKGKVETHYYILHFGKEILLFKGPKTQAYGQFTGLLRPFEAKMADYVRKDATEPFWNGYRLQTAYYLDTTYKPASTQWYFVGFGAVVLGLIALLLPGFLRYTVFVAEPAWSTELDDRMPTLPLKVLATGRFRPSEGRGLGKFEALHPAQVFPDGDGHAVVTWIENRPYRIAIPARSVARVGVDHTGGQASPALKVRAGGQSVVLRMPSLVEARRLARAIAG